MTLLTEKSTDEVVMPVMLLADLISNPPQQEGPSELLRTPGLTLRVKKAPPAHSPKTELFPLCIGELHVPLGPVVD